ncbi:hypothetical protein ACFE04_030823 [Oxalis oulophora]
MERKPFEYLTKGSKVEIGSTEQGFKGSYFTATILFTPDEPSPPWPTSPLNSNTYVIQYDYFTTEDGKKPLRELVDVSCIRPLPPLEDIKHLSFELNDVVEAFFADGWWVGVVDKVKRSASGSSGSGKMKRYRVRFEDPLHFTEFDENMLRPHFDWVDGKWVSFESSKKETTHVSKSDNAACRTRKALLEKTLPSEKISFDVVRPSKTQQEKVTAKHCSNKSIKVEGEGTPSRVSKDKSKTRPFALENEGSTFSKCMETKKSLEETSPGVVREILSAKKSVDEREHSRKSLLEKSGSCSDKISVDLVLPSKRQQEKSTPEQSKKLKNVECGGASLSVSKDHSKTSPSALENEGPIFSLVQYKRSVSRKRKVWRQPEKNGKVFNDDEDKTVMNTESAEKELEVNSTAEAFKIQNTENTILHSGKSECISNSKILHVSSSNTENTIEQAFDTPLPCTSKSDNLANVSSLSPFADQNLPFVKSAPIWKILESSEVYKKIPQKPHFRPLYEKTKVLREGLALAHVVNFTNIVDIICTLRFDDPRSKFDDILEALSEFDEHGFDTELLKTHLGKLLSVRTNIAELEVEAKETESQLMEKSREKIIIKEKSGELDKELDDVVNKLKDLEEQKVKLESMKVNNASEITVGTKMVT